VARERFDHQAIEKAAQEKWEAVKLYERDLSAAKDPYYLLFEFPYPSGDLHIGHWYAFALTDIFARFQSMKGKDVLFPIGFDAFGLPAENAAMKYGKDPKAWTYQNMETMRTQLRTMGASVDWSKQVVTCDPEYYRWTQWLFAQLYAKGLAERKEAPVKWCPKDQTVLANEQVTDGACERCGTEVEEKKLTQWFMKITDYAERLLTDLEPLPWREDIKEAQRQWIGKSEGAHLYFSITNSEERIKVFTTRADTLFGATYVVLAPEHPLVSTLTASNRAEVDAYVAATKKKTERERSENKEKTGVELKGIKAINPATKEEVPIYVADYVLGSYGTGAVMAVPAHDERDLEFARKYNLPIRFVIDPVTGTKQENPQDKNKIVAIVEHEGKVLTIKWKPELGGRLTVGGTAEEGEDAVVTALREIAEETGYTDLELIERAEEQVHHEYFAHSKNKAFIAHTTLLHFRLKSDAYQEPVLEEDEKGKFEVEWLPAAQTIQEVKDPLHGYALSRFVLKEAYMGDGALRNSSSFDGRNNREALFDIVAFAQGEKTTNYRIRDWLISRQRYWGCPIPVVYDPEGAPHYVGDENLPWLLPEDVDFKPTGKAPLASSKELQERVTRIFGEGWTPEYDTLDTFVDSSWYFYRYLTPHDANQFSDSALLKTWVPVDRYSGGSEHTTMHLLYARFFHKALADVGLVEGKEPFNERFNRGLILGPDGQKMSKSKGNVVNPDEFVQKYGADAVRMYLAFIGPYNEPGSYPFTLDGVDAMRKFLDRVERLSEKLTDEATSEVLARALAKAAEKVTLDTDRFKFNTAISALMILVNALGEAGEVPKAAYRDLVRMLAPYAPHLAEHLWERLGEDSSVHSASFPAVDASLLRESEVTVVVQVNGKRRGELVVAADTEEQAILEAAQAIPGVMSALEGKQIARHIYVQGRLLNLVIM